MGVNLLGTISCSPCLPRCRLLSGEQKGWCSRMACLGSPPVRWLLACMANRKPMEAHQMTVSGHLEEMLKILHFASTLRRRLSAAARFSAELRLPMLTSSQCQKREKCSAGQVWHCNAEFLTVCRVDGSSRCIPTFHGATAASTSMYNRAILCNVVILMNLGMLLKILRPLERPLAALFPLELSNSFLYHGDKMTWNTLHA